MGKELTSAVVRKLTAFLDIDRGFAERALESRHKSPGTRRRECADG